MMQKNAKLLNISYNKFVRQASAVYGESSAYLVRNKKDEPSDEMMKEMYAIASVHQRNSKAYGVNSEPAKDFRKKVKVKEITSHANSNSGRN